MVEFITQNAEKMEEKNQAALQHKDDVIVGLQAQLQGEAGLRDEIAALKQDNDKMRRIFKVHQKEKTEILKLFDSLAKENMELKKK